MTGRVRRPMSALAAVFRNNGLRRHQIAFFLFSGAEWAVWVAMLVYAYGRGGVTTAGLVAIAQLLPAAAFAPFASALADHHPPQRVVVVGYVAQGLAMATTAAALLLDGPAWTAYTAAALAATAVTVTRPSLATLLPGLARTPEELTAANVVSGWSESLSVLVAPAVAGVLLAVSGPGWVFLLMSALVLLAAMVVLPVHGAPAAPHDRDAGRLSSALGGFAVLRRDPSARLLVGLLGSQYVAIGMLDVLFVVLALDSLAMGQGGAGYLNAAFGAGGVLGIGLTAALVGRARLMPALVGSLGVWAAAFVVIAALSSGAATVLLLAVAGASRSLFDVSGRTLLQRTAPSDSLARVFGVLEALIMAGTAAGALLTPALVNLGGPTAAVIGAGTMMPLLALLGGRRLLFLDHTAHVPVVEIGLLRSLRLFAALPGPQLEGLARSLVPVHVEPGTSIVTQGEPGDRYYAIAEGDLDVLVDGVVVNRLTRGKGFGEIALLRQGPRTATVRSATSARLYALAGDRFLEVLTGHPAAAAAAQEVAESHLAPEGGTTEAALRSSR